MYIYTKKNQLSYTPFLFREFYKCSPDTFYNNGSPFFYICIALFVNPLFRYARSILGVVDYSAVGQMQIAVLFAVLSFCVCFGLTRLLPILDGKYNFTKRVFASKFFYHFIIKGLAIENFLRSPKNWFFFGVFFSLYLILLYLLFFYSYSLSFKDYPFVYICRLFGYILGIGISFYIKCRRDIISHSALYLKPKEKITRWSILRVLGSYRPIAERPVFDSTHNPNKVYPNCTLLFEKKGMAGYIEGVYNFRTHARNFLLGFASTLLSYCSVTAFYRSIDGYGGMRRTILFILKINIDSHTKFLEAQIPPSYLTIRVRLEMLEDCKTLEEKLDVRKSFEDPSSISEEIQKRIYAHFEKEKLLYNKELDIYINVEKDLADKSLVYFLFPPNYNRLKKLRDFCDYSSIDKSLSKGLEELWKV